MPRAVTRVAESAPPFDRLDFVYTPSADVPRDLRYFTHVLGGRAVFAIDGMGAKVAAVELTDGPPIVLLTDHVEGERPILVYRVHDLTRSLDELSARVASGGHVRDPARAVLLVPNAGRPPHRAVRARPPRGGRALRRPLRLLSPPYRGGVNETSLDTSCPPLITRSITTPIPGA